MEKELAQRECYFGWKELYSMQYRGGEDDFDGSKEEKPAWLSSNFLAQMAAAVEYKHTSHPLLLSSLFLHLLFLACERRNQPDDRRVRKQFYCFAGCVLHSSTNNEKWVCILW